VKVSSIVDTLKTLDPTPQSGAASTQARYIGRTIVCRAVAGKLEHTIYID